VDESPLIEIITVGWWGAYPDADSATSSFLLRTQGHNVLIDCGSAVLSHLQRYLPLEELDGVFLSHYHWDHAADIGCLQYAVRVLMDLGKRRNPLFIYGHREDPQSRRLDYLGYSVGRAFDEGTIAELGELRFRFERNDHPDPSFSIRAETADRSLVYISDTGWVDRLVGFARGADLLICESSLYDEFRGKIPGHLTAGEAGRIAAEAEVKRLVLTHLPHWGERGRLVEQATRVYSGPVELAATGTVWTL
jgi:ribonuclease BN (tRNA processing enzyme)